MNEKKINITRESVINIFLLIGKESGQLIENCQEKGRESNYILLMKEKRDEYTQKKMKY